MTDSLGQWLSAPLVYVLAEVRCSPTLYIAKRAAAIQEVIKAEFPLLEPIAELPQYAMPLAAPTVTMYAFSDSDRRRGIVVTPTSICYHVTEYKTSDVFFDQLMHVLRLIEPIYGNDTVTRLGLRYVDCIVPRQGESVFDYVAPGIAGMSSLKGAERRVQCLVEQPRKDGGITLRFMAIGVPLYRAPDLPAWGLRPPIWSENALEKQIPSAILDTDNWLATQHQFESSAILNSLRGMKKDITETFLTVTSPLAHQVWQAPRKDF